MKKIILSIIIALVPAAIYAQQRTVTGIVKDASSPMPGVTVIEKDLPTNGVVTDANGKFQIILKGSSNILNISSIGYVQQEISVMPGQIIEVIMQESIQSLDEVVVVGFGTTSRVTKTGAISSVPGGVIRNVPTANVQNTLTGRIPGFFSQQRSGQPGRDASDFFIRGVSSLNPDGNRPLIIVDDIEYTYAQLSQVNVNEIESITILKDASTTAIYGIKGANGVLIVTTRRGTSGTPQVNLRVESGLQAPVRVPKFLNSYQTALLRNEALSNDGLAPQFTDQDLELFRTGEDPYGHPDVNWYDAIFKKYALQANTNIDISGGTEKVKYFISGGALTQNGNLKSFSNPTGQVNSDYFFRRFNFRSNLDMQVTKTLGLRLDVTGRFGEINNPTASNTIGEIYDYRRTQPYAAPFLNPNGTYAYSRGTVGELATLNARLATLGYTRFRTGDYNILFGATKNLDAVIKGLSLKGRIAYASTSELSRSLFRFGAAPSYYYNPANGSYTINPDNKYVLDAYIENGQNPRYSTNVNLQTFLDYKRTFGDHGFATLLLFNQTTSTRKDNDAWILETPSKFRGYTGRVIYDYKQKYLLEASVAYNGSDRFKEAYGFFPAVSAGWNMAEELFFKEALPFVSLFKLRGSYGIVGSDVVPGNRYLYDQKYFQGRNYSFGDNVTNYPGIYEGDLANLNVTWEKEIKRDIGLDVNLFQNKVALTVDYFNNTRSDQLISRGSIPATIGIGTVPTNLGVVRNHGWDGQLSYRPSIGRLQLELSGVFSHAKNEVLFIDEPSPAFPYLARTGHPINQPFGYTWVGYYSDANDIAQSPKPDGVIVQPGDLKYKDMNNDGKLDGNDQGPIGKPNLPNTTYGFTLGANYRGLSLNILFQGSTGYSFGVQQTGIEPFLSQMQPIHLQRWTPETAESAYFPRLTTLPGGINSANAYPSDFYLIDADYLRLKTVELGCQLPNNWLPLKLNNARFYLNAYNLFTWTSYDLYQQDPEVASNTAGDAYLNQRVVNVGLQIGF